MQGLGAMAPRYSTPHPWFQVMIQDKNKIYESKTKME